MRINAAQDHPKAKKFSLHRVHLTMLTVLQYAAWKAIKELHHIHHIRFCYSRFLYTQVVIR